MKNHNDDQQSNKVTDHANPVKEQNNLADTDQGKNEYKEEKEQAGEVDHNTGDRHMHIDEEGNEADADDQA